MYKQYTCCYGDVDITGRVANFHLYQPSGFQVWSTEENLCASSEFYYFTAFIKLVASFKWLKCHINLLVKTSEIQYEIIYKIQTLKKPCN